ncbi:MAG: PTS system mannose/fructose/sorbose family transporter subunit IID [Vallitalea sp.]|jgi:PTS system mannose-specific IID component|nr:PTS system mannose/fructose/sorbose family transporter subunit IID [Vallitalea sp.]
MKTDNNRVAVPRKEVKKAALRWIFFSHSAQNFERMMGLAFCHTIAPILKLLYKGDDYVNALKRHMQFFNTEPHLGSMIPGVVIALEESNANEEEVNVETIQSTKNALMGPFAGIGDSLVIGTYNPIILSIALGLSVEGSVLGPLFYILVWLGTMLPFRYWIFMKGYDLGGNATKSFLGNQELTEKITKGLTILGLVVIGGIASKTVRAPISYVYTNGSMEIAIEGLLNKIMPNLMPMLITVTSWFLLSKRNWSPNKIMLGIVGFAAAMVALGIM